MNSILLSRLSKDYLNREPRQLNRLANRLPWSGSTLARHPRARQSPKERMALLDSFRNPDQKPPLPRLASPRLSQPIESPPTSYQLPRYFSKGALENDLRKTPPPIPYLLIETNEFSHARPVPGNSMLLRSLCKGKGTLRMNKKGLVYLDIDNRFISSLIPYLKAYGLVRPPYFNLFGSPDGAHIPVIPSREMTFQYLTEITQLGEEFTFEIEGLYSLEPTLWPEVEQVWFFKLKSPALEKLRRRYFLPAIPGGHAFHIAVAVKPRATATAQPRRLPTMRINISFLAA